MRITPRVVLLAVALCSPAAAVHADSRTQKEKKGALKEKKDPAADLKLQKENLEKLRENAAADRKAGNTVGAYYYYRERISDSGFQQSEGTAYWNHRIGDNLRLQTYALAGFSNGSPDWGVGASVKYSF